MGYTHYWRISDAATWQKIWPQLIVDAQRIVDTTKVPLNLHGEYSRGGTKPALVDIDQGIQLNGANRSHEAFIIKNEATNFNFCKTARKPYDEVVTAILLRAAHLAGDTIKVSSDGFWEEWMDGRNLVMELWPDDELVSPWGETKG